MTDKLQRLQELIQLSNDGLSKEDFLDNFKVIIDLIKKLKESNKEFVDGLDSKYNEIVNRAKDILISDIENLKTETLDLLKKEMKKVKSGKDGKDGKRGADGKDADETVVAYNASKMALEEVLPLIPTIDQIEKDLPKLGEPIRDALELLKGDERLDKSAIKGLSEMFDEINTKVQIKNSQIGGQVGHQVMAYDLSSALNGVTKVFSLPSMWRIISITSSSFPTAFRDTVDYTYNAGTHTLTFTSEITASSTLAAGQTITIIYST